ncbi:MAG: hypothetical protein QE285_08565 [Aquabacterium sp.]|nr:hypothetical protein [Aquabacterium sp.]
MDCNSIHPPYPGRDFLSLWRLGLLSGPLQNAGAVWPAAGYDPCMGCRHQLLGLRDVLLQLVHGTGGVTRQHHLQLLLVFVMPAAGPTTARCWNNCEVHAKSAARSGSGSGSG